MFKTYHRLPQRVVTCFLIPPGDGVLDFPEFLNLMSSRMGHLDNEDVLMQAFRVFDTDSDGYITAEELRKVCG